MKTTGLFLALLASVARSSSFDNVSFSVPGGEVVTKLQEDATANIRFQACTPANPKGWETNRR